MSPRRGDRTQEDLGPEPVASVARRILAERAARNRPPHAAQPPGTSPPPPGPDPHGWRPVPPAPKPAPVIGAADVLLLGSGPHPASLEDTALLAQCELTRGRGQGPGGQRRNKVETLVTLLHAPTRLDAHAGERRSAAQNQSQALFRLRLVLATHVRCPVPLGDPRSARWRARCPTKGKATGRIACNPEHAEYPALLAEALDVAFACDVDVKRAAVRLCCTPTQLAKLIKDHPPAWGLLNAHRVRRGEHALK
jgi:hypothetical protein